MTKICTKCGEEKDVTMYQSRVVNEKVYYRGECNQCRKANRVTSDIEKEKNRVRANRRYNTNKVEINKRLREINTNKYTPITTRDICKVFGVKETTYHSRVALGYDSYTALTMKNKKQYTDKDRGLGRKESIRKSHEKRKSCPGLHLQHVYSARVRMAMKAYNATKCYKTEDLLGLGVNAFRQYMENLFTEGMTFGNYGLHGWHIDHIIPCAYFDLTDPEQQKMCFHYTNLQPLWAEENLKKGAKLDYEC